MGLTPEQKIKIGYYLQELMKIKNKKKEDLIQDGLSSTTIWRILKGHHSTDEKYELFAQGLGTTVQEILEKDSLEEAKRHLNLLEQLIESGVEVENKLEQSISNDCYYSYLVNYLAGKYYFYQRKLKKSEAYFLKSVDLSKKSFDLVGDQNILSLALNGLSNIHYEKNDFSKALQLVEEAIESFDPEGDRQRYYFMLLTNKAVILNKLEKIKEARGEIQYLWENRKDITRMSLRINVHDLFATLKKKEKSYDEAISCLLEGIQIAQDNKQFDKLCELMTILGEIKMELREMDQAHEKFTFALSLQEKLSNKTLIVTTYTSLGKLCTKQNNYDLAKQYLDRAIKVADENNYTGPRYIDAFIVIGDLLFKLNKDPIKPYEKALQLAQNQGLDKSIEKLLLKLSICYEGVNEEKSQLFLRQYGKMNFEKEMNL